MATIIDPTVGAGELDKRVSLLQPVYNDAGDEIVSWTTVTSVWASIDAVFAQESNEADRQVAVYMSTVVIRYRTDIDARWRIQDRSHLYEIKGIQDIARRRVRLSISCQEVL